MLILTVQMSLALSASQWITIFKPARTFSTESVIIKGLLFYGRKVVLSKFVLHPSIVALLHITFLSAAGFLQRLGSTWSPQWASNVRAETAWSHKCWSPGIMAFEHLHHPAGPNGGEWWICWSQEQNKGRPPACMLIGAVRGAKTRVYHRAFVLIL